MAFTLYWSLFALVLLLAATLVYVVVRQDQGEHTTDRCTWQRIDHQSLGDWDDEKPDAVTFVCA